MKTFTDVLYVGAMALVQGTQKELSYMRVKLTQEARNGNGDVKQIKLYREVDKPLGGQLLVPRAMPEVLGEWNERKCVMPKHPPTSVEMKSALRPLQKKLTDQWYSGVLDGAHFGGILQSPTGCVDADTEFLTPQGWKRISDWRPSDLVMQYHLNGKATFVPATRYIHKPATTMWRVRTKYGIDQVLSDDHRFIYKTESGYIKELPFQTVRERHDRAKGGFEGKVITTFEPDTCFEIELTIEQIRVQVAVHADGHLNGKRAYLNLKKKRKITRIKLLLEEAGIPYKTTIKKNGYTLISFRPPVMSKSYESWWWSCSYLQLQIVASEAVMWDGNQRNQFYTTSRTCADFIQYAITSSGKRATISIDNREGKPITYVVLATDRTLPAMASSKAPVPIVPYTTRDGRMYCFEVPTGMLILRRNRRIFITGNSGKTVMGLHIASKLKQPTLIVVPRAVLMNQWKERILEHTDVGEDAIGFVRQDTCDIDGKTFVIGLIHSLARRKYRKELYDRFGLVIFDEVHVLGAETFSTVAPKFNSAYRLGLSATPRRKDGMENAFLWHIGPILTKTQTHHVKPKVRQIYYRHPQCADTGFWWAGKFQFARWLNRIAKVPERNLLIAGLIKLLYERDEDILVLSDRLIQLNILRETLKEWGLDDEVGMFTGKTKQLDRKILLGTYGSADMGADIPRLSALVFATPRVDIVQAVGRVLREGNPTVVDVVDASADIMTRWAHARVKRYQKMTDDIKVKDHR